MKYITSPEHFFETILAEPYSLFIYSSYKTCPPCRSLKKWIESDHPNQEHVYYVDMDQPNLDTLCTFIYAMPTLQLQEHSSVLKTIEGFNKQEILDAFQFIQSKHVSAQDIVTESLQETELTNLSQGTSVDEILEQISKRLES
jgi:hypothetical protein